MVEILKARRNAAVAFDLDTGQPRLILSDATDLDDLAWNPPGCALVRLSARAYNQSLADRNDPHRLVIATARRKFERMRAVLEHLQ